MEILRAGFIFAGLITILIIALLVIFRVKTTFAPYSIISFDDKLGKNMSIFTQNVYANGLNKIERFEKIKKHILEEDFNVVFLQEVFFASDFSDFSDRYNILYEKGRLGPKGGLVVLTKSKPGNIEFHKFSEQGTIVYNFFDNLIEKGFLVLEIGNITFINTHLVKVEHEGTEFADFTYNKKQFAELMNFVNSKLKEKRKVVLVGDFNFDEKTEQYSSLSEVLIDQTKAINGEAQYNENIGQVDYIFSSFGKSTRQAKANYSIYASDHPGIGLIFSY